jgi:hypothetical protein
MNRIASLGRSISSAVRHGTMPKGTKPSSETGFTIVEVLVGLALAIAICYAVYQIMYPVIIDGVTTLMEGIRDVFDISPR